MSSTLIPCTSSFAFYLESSPAQDDRDREGGRLVGRDVDQETAVASEIVLPSESNADAKLMAIAITVNGAALEAAKAGHYD